MNQKLLKKIAAISVVAIALAFAIYTVTKPEKVSAGTFQEYSIKRTQYGLRLFAINRWDTNFNGTVSADVNMGPFTNYNGEKILAQINATNFNRATSGATSPVGWKEQVSNYFAMAKTDHEKKRICEMFYNAVLYSDSTIGSYIKNYRAQLKGIGLIPYSFDEITMSNYYGDTIQFPRGRQVSPLVRCTATAVFIMARGGYSPPYKTSMIWEYSVDAGKVMPRIAFNILAS